MNSFWYRDLYKIGSFAGATAASVRLALAVGAPLIGGVLLGHPSAAVAGGATALFVTFSDIGQTRSRRLGTMFAGWLAIIGGGTLAHLLADTPYSREVIVLLGALLAGWASGSHPGVAAVTRFFAIAAAAGTGMRFTDPDVLLSVVVAGVSAFAAAVLVWWWFGLDPEDNVMDWRAGVRRAFQGAGAGIRFTVCYGAAAAAALFAASALGVREAFWATLVVLMVMRREGIACLELTIHYAFGTIVGVVVAGALLRFADEPLIVAALATLVAALARVGFALNPSFGFMVFTTFLLLVTRMVEVRAVLMPHLFETRLYDVTVGCLLALAGTLAATYPRFARHARASAPLRSLPGVAARKPVYDE